MAETELPTDEVTIMGPREAGTMRAVASLVRQGHRVRLVHPLRTSSRRDVERGIALLRSYIERAHYAVLEGPINNMRTVYAVVAAEGADGDGAGARVPRRPQPPILSAAAARSQDAGGEGKD